MNCIKWNAFSGLKNEAKDPNARTDLHIPCRTDDECGGCLCFNATCMCDVEGEGSEYTANVQKGFPWQYCFQCWDCCLLLRKIVMNKCHSWFMRGTHANYLLLINAKGNSLIWYFDFFFLSYMSVFIILSTFMKIAI